MDFVERKEKLASLIEEFMEDNSKQNTLLDFIKELKQNSDFSEKELFRNLFSELEKYLSELSRKELKQRVLLIRSYID